MSDIIDTFNVAASGLSAERLRLQTIATNMANARTTRTGGASIDGLRALRSIMIQISNGFWVVSRCSRSAVSRQSVAFGTRVTTSMMLPCSVILGSEAS